MSIKRIFDIIVSLLVIVFILSWLFPILFIIIFVETRAFPIFIQKRAGLNTRSFNCYKLRTMVINFKQHHLRAIENDDRVTNFGKILRRYAIDELPQFFNVLFGDMSIVGPRPLMISEETEFNKLIPGFSDRLSIKPGLTGLAQSNGYKGFVDNLSDIRIRLKIDLLYKKKQSFLLDIKIILRTIDYLIRQK